LNQEGVSHLTSPAYIFQSNWVRLRDSSELKIQ
jgi:hypothetical protein